MQLRYFFLVILGWCVVSLAQAQTLRATIAELPGLAHPQEGGPFVDLVRAMDEVYHEGEIEIVVHSFMRSLFLVSSGQADFHLPIMRTDFLSERKDHPLRLMEKPMGRVCMVIYSHSDSPVTREMILAAPESDPVDVSMLPGVGAFFHFPVGRVNSVASGLRQVVHGRIAAFVGAQEEADLALREMGERRIHRELYQCMDDVIVLPSGEAGRDTEAVLTRLLERLEEAGRLEGLHLEVHRPYDPWQPAEEFQAR